MFKASEARNRAIKNAIEHIEYDIVQACRRGHDFVTCNCTEFVFEKIRDMLVSNGYKVTYNQRDVFPLRISWSK